MDNKVYCDDVETLARLLAAFQAQGLAYTVRQDFTRAAGGWVITVTGY